MRVLLALFLAVATTGGVFASDQSSLVADGVAAWTARAENSDGARAAKEPIARAVSFFEQALDENPHDLATLTWLLKVLWFQGEHTSLDGEEKLAVFERGRDLAQQAIDRLTADTDSDGRSLSEPDLRRLRSVDHAAELYFWSAAHWGLWGRQRGKIASARQGVAGRIRDFAQITIALNDEIEGAGGHRILGRLHTEAPKLPFVTGWIDREEAVRQLERAVEIAPDDWMNQLYLFEALIEFEPTRRLEAIEGLRALVVREPRAGTLVEDHKILQDARAILQRAES